EVEKMTQDEGSIFLLWRAGILPSPETRLSQVNESNQQVAQEIVHELGGLPLALEQAGAYIEEQHTTLATYLKAYRRRQADLLKKQGRINHDYPHSVATTWSLN